MTFGSDERTVAIVQKACTVLYLLTLVALGIALAVRQFVLGLPTDGYDDLAMIFTANVLVFIGVVLYSGGVVVPRIRPVWLAALYAAGVVLGTAFTALKYQTASFTGILDHLRVVASILGIMTAAYAVLAYAGNRRTERRIDG